MKIIYRQQTNQQGHMKTEQCQGYKYSEQRANHAQCSRGQGHLKSKGALALGIRYQVSPVSLSSKCAMDMAHGAKPPHLS